LLRLITKYEAEEEQEQERMINSTSEEERQLRAELLNQLRRRTASLRQRYHQRVPPYGRGEGA
jgi:hypothetical protein